MGDETWTVVFHPDFVAEFRALDDSVKVALGALLDKLRDHGPALPRPFADTLKGSRYVNMKELRFGLDDDWYRFAFAFDPKQKAVVLCGGGKGGMSQTRFYDALIAKADRRFERWIEGV
ncbi:type II toxin-antitoxin system RelE/ParE family toxin [Devosia sp.]|uniref:type II toxin-antitoxin system RelE/ParE family toxin n=1 Tax=Devosia sp. TaxID=1871048 RepID=UPI003BADB48F